MRKNNREVTITRSNVTRTCIICNNEFIPRNWLQVQCGSIECRKKFNALKQKEYYHKNIEHMRQYTRNWVANNKERFQASQDKYRKAPCLAGCGRMAMKAGNPIRKGYRASGYCRECSLARRQNYITKSCVYCGKDFTTKRDNQRRCTSCKETSFMTLQWIASKWGLTRERIRQLAVKWQKQGKTKEEALRLLANGERPELKYGRPRKEYQGSKSLLRLYLYGK